MYGSLPDELGQLEWLETLYVSFAFQSGMSLFLFIHCRY